MPVSLNNVVWKIYRDLQKSRDELLFSYHPSFPEHRGMTPEQQAYFDMGRYSGMAFACNLIMNHCRDAKESYVIKIPYGQPPPESCFMCNDCQQNPYTDTHSCGWLDKVIEVDVEEARPEWCPIVKEND